MRLDIEKIKAHGARTALRNALLAEIRCITEVANKLVMEDMAEFDERCSSMLDRIASAKELHREMSNIP